MPRLSEGRRNTVKVTPGAPDLNPTLGRDSQGPLPQSLTNEVDGTCHSLLPGSSSLNTHKAHAKPHQWQSLRKLRLYSTRF